MEKAGRGKEILVSAGNKIGLLHNVARLLAAGGINIVAVSGYIIEEKAFLRMLLADCNAGREILQREGYEIEEKDVVVIELDNKVGALENVLEKVEEAGIDLKYLYASSPQQAEKAVLVLSSSNNDALLGLFTR